MITGDESSVCSKILHRGLIYKSDYRRLKARLYCYVKLAPLQQERLQAMKEALIGSFVQLYNTRGLINRSDYRQSQRH